jgi:hypothetical protein
MRYLLLFLFFCSATFTASAQKGIPSEVARDVVDRTGVPSGDYALTANYSYAQFGHNTGSEVSDKEALNGKAWEASSEKSVAEHMFYGPYADVPAGDYVAFFHIRLLDEPNGDDVAWVDACVAAGQQVLSRIDIPDSELKPGKYVFVPLAFHSPGGRLELRLYWNGSSGLRVDRAALFSVKNANIKNTTLRAEASKRVEPPKPSGNPRGMLPLQEPRPFPEIFARSQPPADTLDVVDLRKEALDLQLAVISLEGVVNRTNPSVYCVHLDTDLQWLDWMKQRSYIHHMVKLSALELIKKHSGMITGAVITDPHLPATRNIATMISAIEGTLPLSPRLSAQLKLPVVEDLRGRWKQAADAYTWALDNLWPQMSHHAAAAIWPDQVGLRDYLVQNRIFCFWISGPLDGAKATANPNAEAAMAEKLLAKMPVNCPIMSYPWAGKDVGIGEGPGVTLFAEFAKYLVGSTDADNLSVHSGIRGITFKQKKHACPALDKKKIYASIIISDGDNLPVLSVGNFPQIWKSELRGTLPLGWTLSPSASMLMPDIAEYYYSTATSNDCFLTAVSGIGYTYPDSYALRYRESDRAAIYDGFLKQTGEYMAKMDHTLIWPMNATSRGMISRYAEEIPTIKGIFPDYGRIVSGYTQAVYPVVRNVPVFHALNGWKDPATREEQIAYLLKEFRNMTPQVRPAFMHLFVWNWGFDLTMLKEVVDKLGPDYTFVRPDHLAELYSADLEGKTQLISVPDHVLVMEGQSTTLQVAAQNLTQAAIPMAIETTGLQEAVVESVPATIPPGKQVTRAITGKPAGQEFKLTVNVKGESTQHKIRVNRIALSEITRPLPEGKLRMVSEFEARYLSHISGHEIADKEAFSSQAFGAIPGQDKAGPLTYGPYLPLAAGKYVALYRIKRSGPGEGIVLQLDSCVAGGTRVTVKREISVAELPAGKFVYVPLAISHPGGAIEVRAIWNGNTGVEVDNLTLWELQ